jgi:hypothetical protein
MRIKAITKQELLEKRGDLSPFYDFNFTLSDVAFGFCQHDDIKYFESLVGEAFPFVDPNANMSAAKRKLRTWRHLSDLK